MRMSLLLGAASVTLLGCSVDPTAPLVDGPLFARGGGPTDPTATWMIPLADAGLSLKSDGLFGDGTYSVYANGVCSVSAKIYATEQYSNSGDATIETKAPKGKQCGRLFTLSYPDGVTERLPSRNNVRELQNTESVIPVGSTVKRTFAINPGVLLNNPSRCGRLLFGVGREGFGVGSDSILVTRVDARTWHVQSQPAPSTMAWCENLNTLFSMSVSFLIVASEDLP